MEPMTLFTFSVAAIIIASPHAAYGQFRKNQTHFDEEENKGGDMENGKKEVLFLFKTGNNSRAEEVSTDLKYEGEKIIDNDKCGKIFVGRLDRSSGQESIDLSEKRVSTEIYYDGGESVRDKRADENIQNGKRREKVDIRKFPYMIVVAQGHRVLCGGSLISMKHALTAALCVKSTQSSNNRHSIIEVRAGTELSSDHTNTRHVKQVRIPKKKKELEMNIAILVLNRPFKESPMLRLVKIPSRDETKKLKKMMKEGALCWIAGWGNKNNRKKRDTSVIKRATYSKVLKGVEVHLITSEECNKVVKISADIELCTGPKNLTGPCQKDSGSPLVCQNMQYGVVIKGSGCGKPGEPDVYARVDVNTKFIGSAVRPKRDQRLERVLMTKSKSIPILLPSPIILYVVLSIGTVRF